MVFKGHKNLPNRFSTPTVVPNLVAEYEARSSAHNVMQRPHVNTMPSVQSVSGSMQVPKDVLSQDFPTVVPTALPSNSSSKSIKIPLPISGDVSAILLERPSTAVNQKEKIYKDPPQNSAYSQQPQGVPTKTVPPARAELTALHAPMPFDSHGLNRSGKYRESYFPNTMQTSPIPHQERRTEEPTHNPEWPAQPFATHETNMVSSSRAILPVEILPSTTSQREAPSGQLYAAMSSRDERSGGNSGASHDTKLREIQPDVAHAVGRLTPQVSVPKHDIERMLPTVQEPKAGHRKPSEHSRLGYQLS